VSNHREAGGGTGEIVLKSKPSQLGWQPTGTCNHAAPALRTESSRE
jgi:hypothetical protein